MRDDRACLEDILEAIINIERYVQQGHIEFNRDELAWIPMLVF